MSRKYYCELCDKRFADSPRNRKNHVNGLQHQRMKKIHYDAFREPETILSEELSKRPCRTFLQTGDCRFSAACRFSHLTPEGKQELERQILQKEQAAKLKRQKYAPSIEQWLKKRAKKGTEPATESSAELLETTDLRPVVQEYFLPHCLLGIPNLPVSLLPPPSGSIDNLAVEEWG